MTLVAQGVSILLDLSGLQKPVRYRVLGGCVKGLWDACTMHKLAYQIILEEAHASIPQQGSGADCLSPISRVSIARSGWGCW